MLYVAEAFLLTDSIVVREPDAIAEAFDRRFGQTGTMEALSAGRKALIPFLPAGFPDKERFFAELAALDAGGADVIEIGVPFSDPVADGPVVEKASLHSLENGTTLAWLLEELRQRKGQFRAGLVLMPRRRSAR